MPKMNGFMESFVESLASNYSKAIKLKITNAKTKSSKRMAKARKKRLLMSTTPNDDKRTVKIVLGRNGKKIKLNETEVRFLTEDLKEYADEWDKCLKLC